MMAEIVDWCRYLMVTTDASILMVTQVSIDDAGKSSMMKLLDVSHKCQCHDGYTGQHSWCQ